MSDPYTSKYTPPSVRFKGWCSVNDGISLGLYNALKNVIDWMYDALDNTWDVAREGLKTFNMLFPSQVALEVIKDWELNDFRLSETKFWAIQFWFWGVRSRPIPLPKLALSENFLTSLFAPLNIAIPGSENWLFKDPSDDVIKFGYQFSETRYYYLLSDGLDDFKEIALVIGVMWLLNKLGFLKAAQSIIKYAFNYVTKKGWKRDIDDTNNMTHYLFDDILVSGDSVGDILDEHKDVLDDVAQKVGLRYVLGR